MLLNDKFILIVDNYDSFTYNLLQYTGEIAKQSVKVLRNDDAEIFALIDANQVSHIVLGPGPGRSENAGFLQEVIQKYAGTLPILGVCLGHQAIANVAGGWVTYAHEIMHGKQSKISVNTNSALFVDIPQQIKVARYHSLIVDEQNLPPELEVIAEYTPESGEEGKSTEIMAVQWHCKGEAPCFGVQFHPESILTPAGKAILENFLKC